MILNAVIHSDIYDPENSGRQIVPITDVFSVRNLPLLKIASNSQYGKWSAKTLSKKAECGAFIKSQKQFSSGNCDSEVLFCRFIDWTRYRTTQSEHFFGIHRLFWQQEPCWL